MNTQINFCSFAGNQTYFGSSMPLNRATRGLTSVHRLTLAEYEEVKEHEQSLRRARRQAWPEYTEYTDKYLLLTPSVMATTA